MVTPTVNVNYGQTFPLLNPTGEDKGIKLNYGVNALFYRGVPIIADEKCTANNLFTINENHLFLYELDYSNELVEASKEGFAWTGWKKSANQNAIVSFIRRMADFKSSLINLGTSVLTRIVISIRDMYYYGWYDNPQEANFALAETEREERFAFAMA